MIHQAPSIARSIGQCNLSLCNNSPIVKTFFENSVLLIYLNHLTFISQNIESIDSSVDQSRVKKLNFNVFSRIFTIKIYRNEKHDDISGMLFIYWHDQSVSICVKFMQ